MSKIPLVNLIRYLRENEWTSSEHPNQKIILFKGPTSDSGIPIEVGVPKNEGYIDYNRRVDDVLRIVASLRGVSIQKVIDEVRLMSHDIFKVRVLNTGEYTNSIPLPYAVDSLKSLRDLFVYGACSEQVSLPSFEKPLQVGIKHGELCRFGHTFEGSFGLAINSPIIDEYVQIEMFEDLKAIPFERKVMERIIRGIELLSQSVQENDGDILVNNFETAFNSRMCESLLELSSNKSINIGINVEWSPKFEVSEDISVNNEWVLSRASYEVLEYAAYELNKIEPYYDTIYGNIVTLHSNKNPMSDEEFLRQATVRHDMNGKKILVKLDLNKQNYAIAYEAHGIGAPIKASGKLFKKGNTWKMVDISKIVILE
ncbi:hypothetical protein [Paenibacillus amylolyticus]|uniref:hypothetical protein n=1 Tax=Paenibacillus amylolyticus TaxID=1451 RepID=UPI00344BE00B